MDERFDMIENDGMIHGRFQPFHNGHLDLLKRALARVRKGHKLYIGITKPFKTDNGISAGDNHRDTDDANPYTYEERRAMILKTIEMDEEISDRLKDIIVIPWPLNNEKDLININNYFFKDKSKITQFMNIIPGDEWEYEKNKIFTNIGFQIVDLVNPKIPRITSATDVRGLMSEPKSYIPKIQYRGIKDLKWTNIVPKGTIEIINNLNKISVEFSSIEDYLEKMSALNTN